MLVKILRLKTECSEISSKIAYHSFIAKLWFEVLERESWHQVIEEHHKSRKKLVTPHAQPECPRTWCFSLKKQMKCLK